MDAVIHTKEGPKSLHVCKDGTIDSTGWVAIYEEAFPAGQRQSLDDVMQQLRDGRMELDETRDEHDNILCMTITEVFRHPPVLPTFLENASDRSPVPPAMSSTWSPSRRLATMTV